MGVKGMKLIAYMRWAGYSSAIASIFYIFFQAGNGLRFAQLKQFSWIFDGRMSEHTQTYCRNLIALHAITEPAILFKTIAQELPGSDLVTLRRQGNGHAHITVHAARPLVRINDDLVLVDTQKLVSVKSYIPEALPSSHITVQDGLVFGGNAHDLYNFASRLPAQIHEQYAITWRNKTEIHLTASNLPRITIIAWYNTKFTEALMQAVTKVQQMLMQRPIFKKHRWNIDVRSERQIVVTEIPREGL